MINKRKDLIYKKEFSVLGLGILFLGGCISIGIVTFAGGYFLIKWIFLVILIFVYLYSLVTPVLSFYVNYLTLCYPTRLIKRRKVIAYKDIIDIRVSEGHKSSGDIIIKHKKNSKKKKIYLNIFSSKKEHYLFKEFCRQINENKKIALPISKNF